MSNDYRQIWQKHHGQIPKDSEGRTCEVHHIDGNRSNNNITNLICLTIAEHYEIHFWQGDWYAAGKIAAKMQVPHEELAELSRRQGVESYENGTNAFRSLNEARMNPKIFRWQHLDTGEIVDATIHEMSERVGQKSGPFTRIVEGTLLSFKRWRLYSDEPYERTTKHFKYDSTVYRWRHDDTEEIVELTIKELGNKCGSPSQHLSAVKRGKRSVHKGWRLLGIA